MGKSASFLLSTLRIENTKVGDTLGREHFLPDVLQHLKSRRISRGEQVEFLNGAGLRALCECQDVSTQRYRVLDLKIENRLLPKIEIFLPLPNMDTLGVLVAQATEIGVSKITFLKTEHAQISKDLSSPPVARAQRISDASCEQCSRAWKVDFHPDWVNFEDAIRAQTAATVVVADEELSKHSHIGLENPPLTPASEYRLFIGPEGGWSSKERQVFGEAQVTRLGLGPLILKMPTAVVSSVFFLRSIKN
jgi:16S rRNA (uracil1498-N3)-methyltransferase